MLKQVTLAALLAAGPALLAHGAERGEAKLSLGGKSLAIDYGRPTLSGRDMLAQAKVGDPWRMGADSATTLKSAADLSFGAVAVPKGDYVLKARKDGEEKWTLLFTQDGKTVAEVPLSYGSLAESVEQLTIELHDVKGAGQFDMRWGKAGLKADFKAK